MYSEKVRFQFNKEISHSKRLSLMNELFEELEKQEIGLKKIDGGKTFNYKIKHNGAVTMLSWYPDSTNIIRKSIKIWKNNDAIK